MSEICVVYWLHLREYKDPFQEGYIGVTVNFKRRMAAHHREAKKKYRGLISQDAILQHGWHNIRRTILFRGTQAACLQKELEFRPEQNIGWNQNLGGQAAPLCVGYWKGKTMSEETRAKMRESQTGLKKKISRRTRRQMSERASLLNANGTLGRKTAMSLAERQQLQERNHKYLYTIWHEANGHLSEDVRLWEWCAENGIRQSCMQRVALGQRTHHKGYQCIRREVPKSNE